MNLDCTKTRKTSYNYAINTMLSANRNLPIAIACKLYEKEEISLGKAAEIVGTSIEEMKKILSDHGIKRKVAHQFQRRKVVRRLCSKYFGAINANCR